MKYKQLTIEAFDGLQKYIVVENSKSTYTTFEADSTNPEFIAFLQQAEKENDPYFTEWVEAGNNPADFWTQGI